MAAWLPEFAKQIKKIHCRLWDLLPVVRNHVYHPAFAGSYSLKAVLPALVPALTYEGMAVANGQDAGVAWESLVRGVWISPSVSGQGRLCWTTAARIPWPWCGYWKRWVYTRPVSVSAVPQCMSRCQSLERLGRRDRVMWNKQI